MAVSVAVVNRSVAGNEHIDTLEVTFDSSYSVGGEALSLTPYLGGRTLKTVTGDVKTTVADVHAITYDRPNAKIVANVIAGTQVPDTTDLSATVAVLRVVSQ